MCRCPVVKAADTAAHGCAYRRLELRGDITRAAVAEERGAAAGGVAGSGAREPPTERLLPEEVTSAETVFLLTH